MTIEPCLAYAGDVLRSVGWIVLFRQATWSASVRVTAQLGKGEWEVGS